jgi:hypothetical protein
VFLVASFHALINDDYATSANYVYKRWFREWIYYCQWVNIFNKFISSLLGYDLIL